MKYFLFPFPQRCPLLVFSTGSFLLCSMLSPALPPRPSPAARHIPSHPGGGAPARQAPATPLGTGPLPPAQVGSRCPSACASRSSDHGETEVHGDHGETEARGGGHGEAEARRGGDGPRGPPPPEEDGIAARVGEQHAATSRRRQAMASSPFSPCPLATPAVLAAPDLLPPPASSRPLPLHAPYTASSSCPPGGATPSHEGSSVRPGPPSCGALLAARRSPARGEGGRRWAAHCRPARGRGAVAGWGDGVGHGRA